MAVGDTKTAAYAVVWSDGSWASPTRLASGLFGPGEFPYVQVSCAAAGNCVVVSGAGWASWYSGGHWTIARRIDSAVDVQEDGGPRSVSCSGLAFCVVLAPDPSDASGDGVIFWSGGEWSSLRPIPTLADAVSCSAPTAFCAAAGGHTISSFTSTVWRAGSAGPVQALDLSCVSPTYCLVVGGFHAAGDDAATFDGSSWGPLTEPPGEGPAEGFVDVSCAAPNFCMAVDGGAYVNGEPTAPSNRPPALFRWNGAVWSDPIEVDPVASGGVSAVSCASTTFCVAVDALGDAVMYQATSPT